jgi:NAD(P)-dependent dehydrogenase (short-subunit alcohol dehydrogenase family)
VWAFAEEFNRDERPLHLLVNCADDLHWRHERISESEWGRCHGTNHLGPFLLQQLLVDKMLLTMRKDAAALADASLPDTPDATLGPQLASRMLRPHPYPLGRILTLGQRATLRKATSHRAGWRGRAAAMQANTLASLQLAERLRLSPIHADEKAQPPPHIEVSIVHPGRLRWLPPPARNLLGGLRAPTLACLYAASCPHRSVEVGAYLDGFSLAPPVRRSIDADAESVAAAARAAYERALRLSSAPPRMLWEVVLETQRCSSRVTGTPRRPAQIRGAAVGPRP